MREFGDPQRSLGDLDARSGATIIAAATDVALILDPDGVIQDLAFGNEQLSYNDCGAWLGRHWSETVTVESRPKVEALLKDAEFGPSPKWRHINHPSADGADLPMLYSVVRVGVGSQNAPFDRAVALGRDLRPTVALQQRLVEAQQMRERDYWRLRHAETSYRLLFQLVSEPLLIVDATSVKVLDANPAAERSLGEGLKRHLVGRSLPDAFDLDSARLLRGHLSTVRALGRADDVQIATGDGKQVFTASASLLRREDSSVFILRLSRRGPDSPPLQIQEPQALLLDVVAHATDAFVLTDLDGRIVAANAAFLDQAQLSSEETARGEPLERWLGQAGVDFAVLVANLRQHGAIRLFKTKLSGEFGAVADVEVSAIVLPRKNFLGFTIRDVSRRLTAEPKAGAEKPRSVQELTDLVGRVPLRDLVREATDLIERLCIEAALHLAEDNRASAAEMLGLSRQSFYVKLRRHGLGDLTAENQT